MRHLLLVVFLLHAATLLAAPPVVNETLYSLEKTSDGTYQLIPYTLHLAPASPAPPVTPPPVTPLPDDLAQTVKNALAAVPEYERRDTHVRGLAFTLNFLGPQITRSGQDVEAAIAGLRQLGLTITKEESAKWAPFWDAITPPLRTCQTLTQLADALRVVQQVLESALPDSGEPEIDQELFGNYRSYGLQAADSNFFLEILRLLLPLLLEWLSNV